MRSLIKSALGFIRLRETWLLSLLVCLNCTGISRGLPRNDQTKFAKGKGEDHTYLFSWNALVKSETGTENYSHKS